MSTNSKRPTHRVFHDIRKDGKTVSSREIGAAWHSQESGTFSVKLDYIPLNGDNWLFIKPIADEAAK